MPETRGCTQPWGSGNSSKPVMPSRRRIRCKALERLTAGYAAPGTVSPIYYLGLALREQGRNAEAGDAFFKATWSLAWRGPAYFALAELATRRRDLVAALDLVDRVERTEYNAKEGDRITVGTVNLAADLEKSGSRRVDGSRGP